MNGEHRGHGRAGASAACAWREARHRQPLRRVDRHAARAPCVGGRCALRHTTKTLLCGDLFSRNGAYAPTTTDDIVGPASDAEDGYSSMSLHPASGSIIRGLADLDISLSRSCTAQCSPVTAGQRSTALPATSTAASSAPRGPQLPEKQQIRSRHRERMTLMHVFADTTTTSSEPACRESAANRGVR